MTNLSELSRQRMLNFLSTIKDKTDDDGLKAINEVESFINAKRYGLVWEEHEEFVDVQIAQKVPVFTEDETKKIINDLEKPINFLLEGDNLHSLYLLEKTHKGKIDLIVIDPPYNRGKDDFRYDDAIVDSEDGFRHSKWLSFMSKRLVQAKKLLSETGIITINIDEHEVAPLIMLMEDIFGAQNNLGTIIWNKQNPKGDAHKISTMHEYIIVFANNYEKIKEMDGFASRKKPNAKAMLAKAKQLYSQIGKRILPTDVKALAKVYDYPSEIIEQMKVEYDLEMVNREFANWLKTQDFSSGEKAYKYIDDTGRVYRGVSMAWPNKKKAPDDYFIPLIHPVTGKECPVPARGWRNPPRTMKKLMSEGRIIFGPDETKQPERKYFLDENLTENTPSLYNNADSADSYMSKIGIAFEYPKPVSEVKYLIQNIHPNPKIVLDFFAGSATTGHAVLAVNEEDGKQIKYILCTNNQDGIAENTAYKRLQVESENFAANLKYYRTDYIPRQPEEESELSEDLLDHIAEMVELDFGIDIKTSSDVRLVFDEEELDDLFIDDEMNNLTIFVPNFVLLRGEHEYYAEQKNIKIVRIPDYYFANELKEAGEL